MEGLMKTLLSTVLLVCLLAGCMATPAPRWEIKMINGAYEDILIVINERVPADKSTEIKQNLEVSKAAPMCTNTLIKYSI